MLYEELSVLQVSTTGDGSFHFYYGDGTSFLVEAGKVHQGINMGSVTVKLITTLVVEKGKPANSPAP